MTSLLLLIIYLAFISLGLPDALVGAGWPAMERDLVVPTSYAGLLSMMISGATIISSLFSGLLVGKIGTARLTALSVLLTALALGGFSVSPSFVWLMVLSVPLGLGAGAVDAGLNNYVAQHYEARHMSWLHSFWGLGALIGPLILASLLSDGLDWKKSFFTIALIQATLALMLFASIPLWKRDNSKALAEHRATEDQRTTPFFSHLRIKGVPMALISFFLYCSIEATFGLWGATFLVDIHSIKVTTAALLVSLYYGGITVGRITSGFLAHKLSNSVQISIGLAILFGGVLLTILPLPELVLSVGFFLIGLGCAPIFPCLIHETPTSFGAQNSATIIGFQMAAAYIGTTFVPPLFGLIADRSSLAILPVALVILAIALLLSLLLLKRQVR